MLNLRTESDLAKFLESIHLSINLFRKSLEYIRQTDQKFALEYGSFVYQLSSFCSRQLKTAKIIQGYFSAPDVIAAKLSRKSMEFLHMSLDVYKRANASSSSTPSQKQAEAPDTPPLIILDSESSSATGLNSNENSMSNKGKIASVKAAEPVPDQDWGEEWLHHYMFGKIKEKLGFPLLECLEHYRKVGLV